jgi:hypothetical protein
VAVQTAWEIPTWEKLLRREKKAFLIVLNMELNVEMFSRYWLG